MFTSWLKAVDSNDDSLVIFIKSVNGEYNVMQDVYEFTMQSTKNEENTVGESPGKEEVTISLEEFSEMKKRLQGLGGIDPRMQSQKEQQSQMVVPETPHEPFCYFTPC